MNMEGDLLEMSRGKTGETIGREGGAIWEWG